MPLMTKIHANIGPVAILGDAEFTPMRANGALNMPPPPKPSAVNGVRSGLFYVRVGGSNLVIADSISHNAWIMASATMQCKTD
jgi:hypothetical protein